MSPAPHHHRELVDSRQQGVDFAVWRGNGRVVKIGGRLLVNLSLSAYYNALRPEFGSTWQLRMQLVFIF